MENRVIVTVLLVFLFLIVVIGGIILQIFLSRRQNKWLGLILPAISLIISLVMVLSIAAFSTVKATARETGSENSVAVEQQERTEGGSASAVLSTVSVFLLSNIPTVILTGIYFACREKLKKNKEIEKMNIQDLE